MFIIYTNQLDSAYKTAYHGDYDNNAKEIQVDLHLNLYKWFITLIIHK